METVAPSKIEDQKSAVLAESRPSAGQHLPAWVMQRGWVVLPVLVAVVLGVSIARGNWLLLAGMAVMGLMVLWPISITLGAFAFLVPFDVVSVVGNGREGTTLTFVAGAAAGLALMGTTLFRRKFERPLAAAVWWFLFIAWGGATILWAHDPGRALARLPSALVLVLFAAAAATVRITKKELNWILIGTIAGGCAAGGYAVKQYFGGQFYHSVTSGRSTLAVGANAVDPNFFAASLFLPLALAVGYFLLSKGWMRRGLSMAASGLIVLAIFTTMSRGALVGLAVMLFVFIRRLGVNVRILIAAGLILLSVLAVSDRLLARFDTAEESGGSGRMSIWPVGVAALKHVGLFGAGLDNFRNAYMEYLSESGVHRVRTYNEIDAHNIYLALWVELGIPGLVFLLMAYTSLFRSSKKARASGEQGRWLVPFEAAAWAMLVSCFFVGLHWQKSYWLLWILFPLAIRVFSKSDDAEEFRDGAQRRTVVALSPASRRIRYSLPLL